MPIRESQSPSNVEGFREEPLLQVRRLYVSFAQGLFSAAPRGSYHWEPNMVDSEVIITDENPINIDVVGKRPAISFTRGPAQFFGLGIDDLDKYNFATGAKQKTMLIPGTMSINCCSRNDLESERLAWLYAEQLWMHREMLMRAGMFEIGRQMIIGSPSPAGSIVAGDSADEWYSTSVQSPFQFNRTSRYTPLNEKVVNEVLAQLTIHRNPIRGYGPLASTASPNLPYAFEEVQEGNLPKLKHPLDPTRTVIARGSYPYRPGIRPPTIRGRTIPIRPADVEGSELPSLKLKV